MLGQLAPLVVLAALVLVNPLRADEVADEKKKMEGTWEVIEVWANGAQIAAEEVKERSMTIEMKGETWTIRAANRGEPREAKVSLLPKEKPMGIDMTIKGPDGKENKALAIYEWKKDGTLRLCVPDRSDMKERPKDFTSENGHVIMILKKKS